MSKYIELNRVFYPIPKDYSFDESAYDSPFAWSSRERKTWDDLIQLLVPQEKVDPSLAATAMDAEKILPSWDGPKIRTLLARPILDDAIRIHGVGFDAPVPIELKIANNNWSGAKLRERLENQLIGQYLRDQRSNLGVFLLVNTKQKKWEYPETRDKMSFSDLLCWLQIEGAKMVEDKSASRLC